LGAPEMEGLESDAQTIMFIFEFEKSKIVAFKKHRKGFVSC
jgi:hypothetical protein